MVATALILSYFKIELTAFGSINFVMVPLMVFSWRWGVKWGVGAGAVYGTLKFLLAAGMAFNWLSILLDYTLAYAAVGFAGVFRRKSWGLPAGALVGSLARYLIHFVSGITIYAITGPEEVMGLVTANMWLYSFLYNIVYMGPNAVISFISCLLLKTPLEKIDK